MAAALAISPEAFQAVLQAEVARGRAEVVVLEWSAQIRCAAGTSEPGCPRCGSPKRVGHSADYRLGAIVQAVR